MQILRILPWAATFLAGSIICGVAKNRMTLVAGSGAATLVGAGVGLLAGSLLARGLRKPIPTPR